MTKLVITDCSIRNLPTFFIPLLYFLVGIIYCQIARTAITRFTFLVQLQANKQGLKRHSKSNPLSLQFFVIVLQSNLPIGSLDALKPFIIMCPF